MPIRSAGRSATRLCFLIAALAPVAPAQADVVISSAATKNMSCSNGVCAPTAKQAVLNVSDLETDLASGNVVIKTLGAGVQAKSIKLDAPLTWSSNNALSLDAYQSVLVKKLVTVTGAAGLSIVINDGGRDGIFAFSGRGRVNFANLASTLTVNGAAYALEGSIAALAAAIAADPTGDYALASDYDAAKDGTYQDSPIPTEFSGAFEGLGNTISDLSIEGTGGTDDYVGLFAQLTAGNKAAGSIENISIKNFSITGNGLAAGGLVGFNSGMIINSYVDGKSSSEFDEGQPSIGLIAGANFGSIAGSGASGSVSSHHVAFAGGLVGENGGAIEQSFVDGDVSAGADSGVGGLAGYNEGNISESYATGRVRAERGKSESGKSQIGGLVGYNVRASTVAQTYSTTAVSGSGYKGGLIGYDSSTRGNNMSDYWDTQTSNISNPRHAAGHPGNDPGITGLTTAQLQAGLPAGFDTTIWAENPKINGGLPYLIANPPPK